MWSPNPRRPPDLDAWPFVIPAVRQIVADEVLDGSRSVVVREAFNRMVVQMAVLYRMLKTV